MHCSQHILLISFVLLAMVPCWAANKKEFHLCGIHYKGEVQNEHHSGGKILYEFNDVNQNQLFLIQVLPRMTPEVKKIQQISEKSDMIEKIVCVDETDPQNVHIVLHFNDENTLEAEYTALYERGREAGFNEQKVRNYLMQIKEMLQLLEKNKIELPLVYSAMLLTDTSKDRLRFAAFGLLGIVPTSLREVEQEYIEPEHTFGAKLDTLSSIWSVGATLYEMYYLEPPAAPGRYEDISFPYLNREITKISPEMKTFIKACLKPRDRRISLETFLQQVDQQLQPWTAAEWTDRTIGLVPNGYKTLCGQQYQVLKYLSRGSFGSVFLALNRENGESVAIKQLTPKNESEETDLKREITALQYATAQRNDNVIGFHCFDEDAAQAYLVLEYCENGDLENYLKKIVKTGQKQMDEQNVRGYLKQLSNALRFLYENRIFHRDLIN